MPLSIIDGLDERGTNRKLRELDKAREVCDMLWEQQIECGKSCEVTMTEFQFWALARAFGLDLDINHELTFAGRPVRIVDG